MNKQAIYHAPKSHMCYAYDEETLHITLRCASNDIKSVLLIIEDPFNYKITPEGTYIWCGKDLEHQFFMEKKYETSLFDYYFIKVKVPTLRSKYAFVIKDLNNETYFYGSRTLIKLQGNEHYLYDLFNYFNYPYINKEDLYSSPSWSKNTIWYQIFPDRFNKSKNKIGNFLEWNSITTGIRNNHFFGGDLKGVEEKIPYLKELGITGIYFTPICESPSSHKYDTNDYFKIDPQFGTNEDLKSLVKACHDNGIKVMLDLVFNHCGWNFFMWQDVLKNGNKSKYLECFFINEEAIENNSIINFPLTEDGNPDPKFYGMGRLNYKTFAYAKNMPKLNTESEIVTNYLLDVTRYYIKEFDIDGYRLDVSNEVSHTFWKKFRNIVKELKKDVYINGENWDDSSPWLKGDQFDSVMNYQLTYPVWNFFTPHDDKSKISSIEFRDQINTILVNYPHNVSEQMFNLLSTHDTERIIHRAKGNVELVKLAYLFIFSFVGNPSIYYGDEIGLEGAGDPDNRRCMIWDKGKQNLQLFNFFKKIIALKKTEPAFNSIDIKWHHLNNDVLVYQKCDVIFILNNNSQIYNLVFASNILEHEFLDLFNYKSVKYDKFITLNPYEFKVLKIGEKNESNN